MKSVRSLVIALATAGVLSISANAQAATIVIGFEGLVDFNNYSEDGVNITGASLWNWPGQDMAHIDSGFADFTLATSADFSLLSVEKGFSGGSGAARFEGFLNGLSVGVVDVAADGVFNFGTTFLLIDAFRLTVPGTHFTIDNVTLDTDIAAVPEPATLALLGSGLAAAAARRRRARRS